MAEDELLEASGPLEALAQTKQGVLVVNYPDLYWPPYQPLLDCAIWAFLLRKDRPAAELEHLGCFQLLNHFRCRFVVGLAPKELAVQAQLAASPL